MASEKIRTTNDADFSNDVLSAPGPILVDFWATWCGPCRAMEPHLQTLADEFDKIDVYKVNIEESQATAQQYNVTSVPTLMIFRRGQIIDKMLGNPGPKKLREFIEKACNAV